MNSEALIEFRKNADELEIVGSGSWTAANAGRLDALIGTEPRRGHSHVRVDMSGVREFDTYGAWLLERLLREVEGADGRPPSGLPDRYRGFFELDRFRDLFEKVLPDQAPSRPAKGPAWARLKEGEKRTAAVSSAPVSRVSDIGKRNSMAPHPLPINFVGKRSGRAEALLKLLPAGGGQLVDTVAVLIQSNIADPPPAGAPSYGTRIKGARSRCELFH